MNQIMGKQKDEEINLKTEKKEKAPKKKSKKNKKSKGIIKKILITIAILIVIGVSTLGILLYGPYNGFRDWLITSAMTTMTHQWIAYLFYDEDTINAVMASNRVDEVQEGTYTNAIVVGVSEEPEKTYENEYEKAILLNGQKDCNNKSISLALEINVEFRTNKKANIFFITILLFSFYIYY